MGVVPREADYSTLGGPAHLLFLPILPPGSTFAPSMYQELNPCAKTPFQQGPGQRFLFSKVSHSKVFVGL